MCNKQVIKKPFPLQSRPGVLHRRRARKTTTLASDCGRRFCWFSLYCGSLLKMLLRKGAVMLLKHVSVCTAVGDINTALVHSWPITNTHSPTLAQLILQQLQMNDNRINCQSFSLSANPIESPRMLITGLALSKTRQSPASRDT